MLSGSTSRWIPILALLLLGACAGDGGDSRRYDAARIADWPVWGIGETRLVAGGEALELREGADSAGVNLVSPFELPRDVRVRLRLEPRAHEGVVVVLLSAAPLDGSELRPPPDYRGEQSLWKEGAIGSYAFAFHTAFHQPNAFVARNPGWERLIEVPDVAGEERAYDVEVGRRGERLWLAIDGAEVFEASEPDPPGLGSGHMVLRLRGPGDGSFATRIESIEVEPIAP